MANIVVGECATVNAIMRTFSTICSFCKRHKEEYSNWVRQKQKLYIWQRRDRLAVWLWP